MYGNLFSLASEQQIKKNTSTSIISQIASVRFRRLIFCLHQFTFASQRQFSIKLFDSFYQRYFWQVCSAPLEGLVYLLQGFCLWYSYVKRKRNEGVKNKQKIINLSNNKNNKNSVYETRWIIYKVNKSINAVSNLKNINIG